LQGDEALRALIQLLYLLSYPPNGGTGIEPATHWLRSSSQLRHLQYENGRAKDGWSILQESNLRLAALSREVSPTYGIFRCDERAKRRKATVLLSYPPKGGAGVEPATFPTLESHPGQDALTEVGLHYGTVHNDSNRSERRTEHWPEGHRLTDEVSLLYGILLPKKDQEQKRKGHGALDAGSRTRNAIVCTTTLPPHRVEVSLPYGILMMMRSDLKRTFTRFGPRTHLVRGPSLRIPLS